MESFVRKLLVWLFLVAISLTMIQCGASNRLREYEFRNRTAAATMAAAPRAQVFTESFFRVDENNVVGTALRLGTSIVKATEVRKTQERLDRAVEQIDIPERIRAQTLRRCSEYLHFQPIEKASDADFLLMMYIDKYGINAGSWSTGVDFKIDVEVLLVDNVENITVWKKVIKEERPISRKMFGLGGAASDVVTAVTLAELSEEEMVEGFSHLADYVADRIAERMQKDFLKAHSD
jgi:hypothetical protein